MRSALGETSVTRVDDSSRAARGLRLVSASAGSGKTYRLTEEVIRAVDPSSPALIEMDGLIGVTYTKKAQAELETRISGFRSL